MTSHLNSLTSSHEKVLWTDSAFVGNREEVESTLMGPSHEHIIIAADELSVWCLCFSRVALAALWTERLSWWTLNIPSDHGILPNSLHDAARAHKVAMQLIRHTYTVIHIGAHQHTHTSLKTCTHTYWPSDLWTFCVWVWVCVIYFLSDLLCQCACVCVYVCLCLWSVTGPCFCWADPIPPRLAGGKINRSWTKGKPWRGSCCQNTAWIHGRLPSSEPSFPRNILPSNPPSIHPSKHSSIHQSLELAQAASTSFIRPLIIFPFHPSSCVDGNFYRKLTVKPHYFDYT